MKTKKTKRSKRPRKKMSHYELHLPYFKQGDDLSHMMWHTKNHGLALEQHADMLEEAVAILRRVAKAAKADGLRIDQADTHYIGVRCPTAAGEKLVKEGVIDHPPDLDDDDDPGFTN